MGVSGRIPFLYEDKSLTFSDLINIVEGIKNNDISLAEKVDGWNVYFSVRNNKTVIARNLTEIRNGGLSLIQLSQRDFASGGKTRQVFVEAYRKFDEILKENFSIDDLNEIFSNKLEEQIFLNFEIIFEETQRLVPYNKKGFVFLPSRNYAVDNSKKIKEINNLDFLQNFKNKLNENSFVTWADSNLLTENIKGSFDKTINDIKNLALDSHLSVNDKLSEYYKNNTDNELENILYDFSTSLLENLESSFVDQTEENLNKLKELTTKNIQNLFETKNPEIVEKTLKQIRKIKNVNNINTLIEGVVFEYKDKVYKFTGHYGPINQLHIMAQKNNINEADAKFTYPIGTGAASYDVQAQMERPVTAIIPGSFKPPHAGHWDMYKQILDMKTPDGSYLVHQIIILISKKSRVAHSAEDRVMITPEISKNLWERYLQEGDDRTEIRISEHESPIQDIYEIMLNEIDPDSVLMLVKSEKDSDSDRFDAFEKFSYEQGLNIAVKPHKVKVMAGGISAAHMREFLANDEEGKFKGFLPDHLSSMERDQIWQELRKEMFAPVVESMMIENFFLSGEQSLVEGRKSDTIRLYPEIADEIKYLSKKDPSGNNKYLQWMAKQLHNKKGTIENILWAVNYFHDYNHAYDNKDIFSYELSDLISSTWDNLGVKQSDVLYEDEQLQIIRPKTHQGSVIYAGNPKTEWCIAYESDRNWKEITEQEGQVPFYLFFKEIIRMSDDKDHNGRFAIMYLDVDASDPDSIWNANDNLVSWNEFINIIGPEIWDDTIEQEIDESLAQDPPTGHNWDGLNQKTENHPWFMLSYIVTEEGFPYLHLNISENNIKELFGSEVEFNIPQDRRQVREQIMGPLKNWIRYDLEATVNGDDYYVGKDYISINLYDDTYRDPDAMEDSFDYYADIDEELQDPAEDKVISLKKTLMQAGVLYDYREEEKREIFNSLLDGKHTFNNFKLDYEEDELVVEFFWKGDLSIATPTMPHSYYDDEFNRQHPYYETGISRRVLRPTEEIGIDPTKHLIASLTHLRRSRRGMKGKKVVAAIDKKGNILQIFDGQKDLYNYMRSKIDDGENVEHHNVIKDFYKNYAVVSVGYDEINDKINTIEEYKYRFSFILDFRKWYGPEILAIIDEIKKIDQSPAAFSKKLQEFILSEHKTAQKEYQKVLKSMPDYMQNFVKKYYLNSTNQINLQEVASSNDHVSIFDLKRALNIAQYLGKDELAKRIEQDIKKRSEETGEEITTSWRSPSEYLQLLNIEPTQANDDEKIIGLTLSELDREKYFNNDVRYIVIANNRNAYLASKIYAAEFNLNQEHILEEVPERGVIKVKDLLNGEIEVYLEKR